MKKILGFFVILFFSTQSVAEGLPLLGWSDGTEVSFKEEPNEALIARIDHNDFGKKTFIIFQIQSSKDACTQDTGRSVLRINGTAVNFNYECEHHDGKLIHLYYPHSDAGAEHIMNQFRQKTTVSINGPKFKHSHKINAIGFTDAWNNFGGDAL